MRTLRRPEWHQQAETRQGVTLTEVLMSLMIMSIGIASVAVLFPISVLRSIQASQLTNSALLKYVAETQVEMQPELVFDPDGDFFNGPTRGDQRALQEHYARAASRNYLVDPVGYYAMFGIDANGDNNVNTADGEYARWFGNDGNAAANAGVIAFPMRRFDGGILKSIFPNQDESTADPTIVTAEGLRAMKMLADSTSKLGTSWKTDLDTFVDDGQGVNGLLVVNGAPIGAYLPLDIDLSDLPTSSNMLPKDGAGNILIPDPESFEVVVFSADGTISQAYPLTHIDTGTNVAYWSELDENGNAVDFNRNGWADVRSLPTEFLEDTDGDGTRDTYFAGRVVLRSARANDYNWMLTVRRTGDGRVRGVDVVVRSGAGLNPEDERIYPAQFVSGGFNVGLQDPYGEEIPLKRGGFIFDLQNARWYRIRGYEEIESGGTYQYQVALESSAVRSSGNDTDLDGAADGGGSLTLGAALVIPGVIEVYPMGTMDLPEFDL